MLFLFSLHTKSILVASWNWSWAADVTWTVLPMSLLRFWDWEHFSCIAVYAGSEIGVCDIVHYLLSQILAFNQWIRIIRHLGCYHANEINTEAASEMAFRCIYTLFNARHE